MGGGAKGGGEGGGGCGVTSAEGPGSASVLLATGRVQVESPSGET